MTRVPLQLDDMPDDGIAACRCPMYVGFGAAAGYCDKPAYGHRPTSPYYRNAWTGEMRRYDGRYDGHVDGPACPSHGGPRSRVYRDGNAWCAVMPDFQNLQESHAGFGPTPDDARDALAKAMGVPAEYVR